MSAIVFAASLSLRAFAQGFATVPELPVLPEVRSENGVARLALTAFIDRATGQPAFAFLGRTTAPTIRVRPGDTIVIDYRNALPYETQAPLDETNLHFHGLTVSPDEPGDQVIMTMIAPGQTYRYVVHVPPEQAPGLYWYHPHPHGESNRQVAAGMSGLIVVDGIVDYAPAISGLAERDIILRDSYFDPGTAPFARAKRRSALDLDARYQPDCNAADAESGVTINGLPQATISMPAGSSQFFRVANSSANSFVDLSLDGSQLYVVANDGVPIGYHAVRSQGYLTNHVVLPPAGRVEFVNASPLANGAALRSACIATGPAGDVNPAHVLATIRLRAASTVAVRRPSQSVFAATPHPPSVDGFPIATHRSVDFSEDNAAGLFYINGRLWNPSAPPMFVAHTGTLEEWTVRNFAHELHAFHIHQIHFLVEDVDGVKAPPNTWRDTLEIPFVQTRNGVKTPGVAHLLMDFRDPVIAGTFVFHCHILEHEDGGMMAAIQVLPPGTASADNPFAQFVRSALAFVRSVAAPPQTGRSALLAALTHWCGPRVLHYSTGPLAPGFVRRGAVTKRLSHATVRFASPA